MNNLFEAIPSSLPKELVEVLVSTGGIRIERIVSDGHRSPQEFWYDQTQNEWVVVLAGKALLRYADGRELSLNAGDHVLIPAHEKHRVEWTSNEEQTIWLAVFFS